jgi:alkylated DNA repair dioxygenase AlkB
MFLYEKNFLKINDYNMIRNYLELTNNFKSNPKCSNNNKQGRLQKWYHKNNIYFCPEWNKEYDWWKSFKYDNTLLKIQQIVQNKMNKLNYNIKINSCLINKYRNGNDYISPHRDSKISFGEEPIVCILSIGQKRTLRFVKTEPNLKKITLSKKHKDNIKIDFELEDNSIFIMSGNSQNNYSHEILKDNSINERYSLTFREHLF